MRVHVEKTRVYDFAAAGIALVAAVVELIRIATSGPLSAASSSIQTTASGIVLCFLLAGAAIGMVLHRWMGWAFAVLAFVFAAAHAVVLFTAGLKIGLVDLVAAIALFVAVVKSLHSYRSDASDVIAHA